MAKVKKFENMAENAETASQLLKALCALADGEKSVSELTEALDMRQATVSQHLARLRLEGLATTRRDAQTVYYSIADETADCIVQVLYKRFCGA